MIPTLTLARGQCDATILSQQDIATLRVRQREVNPNKVMNGQPKSRYHVTFQRSLGLPTGGDPYGNGVSIVVRERENRSHGEVRQVVRY